MWYTEGWWWWWWWWYPCDGGVAGGVRSLLSSASSDSSDPPAGGRNPDVDFRGKSLSNDTHQSTTDPQARLYRKGQGKEAKLCFMGHALMENRNGLIVDGCVTQATGQAERVAALAMIEKRANRPTRITLGADKGDDAADP